jgi:hypothetical protein
MILGISSLGTILEIVRGLVEPARRSPLQGIANDVILRRPSSAGTCEPASRMGNGGRASGRLLALLSVGRAGACVRGGDSRILPH